MFWNQSTVRHLLIQSAHGTVRSHFAPFFDYKSRIEFQEVDKNLIGFEVALSYPS